jgi:hypothetical protein
MALGEIAGLASHGDVFSRREAAVLDGLAMVRCRFESSESDPAIGAYASLLSEGVGAIDL